MSENWQRSLPRTLNNAAVANEAKHPERSGRNSMLNGFARQCACLAVCLTALLGFPAIAEEEMSGAEEYHRSCGSCHGASGKGDGPQVASLSIEPTDLTMIARNNGGVFPERRVLETIDGRWFVFTHGDRDMPVWGERYSSEMGGDEYAVRARVLRLVDHIRSIQE